MKMCLYCDKPKPILSRGRYSTKPYCSDVCKILHYMETSAHAKIPCDTCGAKLPHDVIRRYDGRLKKGDTPKWYSCSKSCDVINPKRKALSSSTMSKTNGLYASDRMKVNNPMFDTETKAKMAKTMRAKYKDVDPFEHTRGGNGRGLTFHETLLSYALSKDNITHINQAAISLGKRQEGYPTCYKPDILIGRLCIEIDGTSHKGEKARLKDTKKEEKLCELGYKTIRFTNGEVEDIQNCVQIIKSMI